MDFHMHSCVYVRLRVRLSVFLFVFMSLFLFPMQNEGHEPEEQHVLTVPQERARQTEAH